MDQDAVIVEAGLNEVVPAALHRTCRSTRTSLRPTRSAARTQARWYRAVGLVPTLAAFDVGSTRAIGTLPARVGGSWER